MLKITKGTFPNVYSIYAYNFIKEANFYAFLYSARDMAEEDTLFLIENEMKEENKEEARWALDIARLTNCNAVISDKGDLVAVPVRNFNRDYTTKYD